VTLAPALVRARPESEPASVRIRRLEPPDLARVVELDARCRGRAVPEYWRRVRADFLRRDRRRLRVALGANLRSACGAERRVSSGPLVGFLFGEERAFEFGSEPCGWIFAVAVDPGCRHAGVGSQLLAEACRRFRRAGLARVRTMVRRSDVPVLAFFRAHGFAAGEFTQLEVDLPPVAGTEER
jgi:ribosomal protein S18 acetylase RimI-like enzyme